MAGRTPRAWLAAPRSEGKLAGQDEIRWIRSHRQQSRGRIHRPELRGGRAWALVFPERAAAGVRDARIHALDLPARGFARRTGDAYRIGIRVLRALCR